MVNLSFEELGLDPVDYVAMLMACILPSDDPQLDDVLRYPPAWSIRKSIERYPDLGLVESGTLLELYCKKQSDGVSSFDIAANGEWYDACEDFIGTCISNRMLRPGYTAAGDWGEVDEWGVSQAF